MDTSVGWLVGIGIIGILTTLVAIPAIVVALEIVFGVFQSKIRMSPGDDTPHGRIAVLVPAHNESSAVAPTLEDIKRQLRPDDRLLVVADNCTDDTANVARMSGAEVVERNEPERIGKGYALDCALRYLNSDPPDVVVMIDADCRIAGDTIGRLASLCAATGRPTQALYLMTAPEGSQLNHGIAEFAWRVKNWVRPLGLRSLGLPCQLFGAGMAFPWHAIRGVDLASGWIVEDLKLGLDLAAAGHPPLFCPSACVTSHFASSARGADIQRKRWEHGHIMTILKKAPRLLYVALTRRNLSLLVLTLDLAVPPLSLLVILLTVMSAVTGVVALLGRGSSALVVSATCVVGLATAIFLGWKKYGRDILPPRSALSLPRYVVSKLELYGQILFGRATTRWIRTNRTQNPETTRIEGNQEFAVRESPSSRVG